MPLILLYYQEAKFSVFQWHYEQVQAMHKNCIQFANWLNTGYWIKIQHNILK